MHSSSFRSSYASLLIAVCCASRAVAQLPSAGGEHEVQTVVGARQSLDDFFSKPGESLPAAMLQRAEGVAIFPNMIKGGFILGVNYGRGVLHVRNPDRTWSPPAMVSMGGGSVGFQVGVQSADILLIFATPRSLNGILQGKKVTLGADASVAAGPVGIQANAGTDARLGAEIYSYARSRGLFLGVSLGGADLSVDDNANAVLYGRFGTTTTDVFQRRGIGIRPEVQQLIDALDARSGNGLAATPAPAAVIPTQPLPAVPIASPAFPPTAITPPQAVPSQSLANPPLVPITR